MKFGKKINADLYSAWREYYLDYNKLKRELKNRTTARAWGDEDERAFTDMLEVELDKVHAFQRHKTTELARRIAQAEEDVHKLVKQEEAYHASLAALVQADGGQSQSPSPSPNGGTGGRGQHQQHHLQGLGHARMPTGRAKTFPSAAAVDIERHAGRNGLHADGHVDAAEEVVEEEDEEDDSDDDALGDESSSKSADTFEEQFRWLEEEVATLVADVHDLALYSKLNLTGFMKILKKHDKQTGQPLRDTFIHTYLDRRPFYKYNWDGLIVKLSKLYDLVRTRGHPVKGDASAGGSQSAFVRQTTKYWVHPDNLVHLKLAILRHLPVLVFNPNKEFEGKDAAITSIYFDNEDLELYLGRLEKTEGAEAIRLRWYGDMNVKQIFVERKTHREDWTGEKSVKARFPIKEENVNAFLRGDYTMDEEFRQLVKIGKKTEQEVESMIQLATEVQYAVLTRKMRPVMRTFYNRTAFQLPGDARVRISLDTELTMVREDNWDGRIRSGDNWRRMDIGIDHPFPQLPDDDKELFKYGILEVKLQTQYGQEPPLWVTELVQSHLVEAVPKFSKFIHGCATLLPHRVDLVPFWLPQMDIDILKPDTGKMHIERPSHQGSASTSTGGSPMMSNPDLNHPGYTEPISEGEEDDYAVAPALNEHKATGLSSEAVAEAIAERKRTLAESMKSKESLVLNNNNSQAGLSKVTTPDRELDEPEYAADDERAPLLARRPASGPATTQLASKASKQRALSINPLAPAAAFDRSFKQLKTAFSSEQDESALDDPETDAPGVPAGQRLRGEDRELVRYWSAAPGQRIAVPVRIEPKVYFASERTFLSWLQFGVLIGSISTTLLNFVPPDDTKGFIAAGLFTFAALLAIAYSSAIFVYRALKLRKRHAEGLYYDKWGPTVLCAVLGAALLTNMGMRVNEM